MKHAAINQLTLGVGLRDEATFANYYASQNQHLVEELKKSTRAAGERVIYFYGVGGGEGGTHLLQACCHEANQHQQSSVYIPLANLTDFAPEIFSGLEDLQLICIDDVQHIAGKPVWEEAFFHLYNRIHDAGGRLLVTANVSPKLLNFMLPDVVSRLAWGIVFQLQALTDAEKLQVLMMRAERRGMILSEEVGKFILTHSSRHMSTLFAILDTLDKVSLAAQRKLTVPFVKSVLKM